MKVNNVSNVEKQLRTKLHELRRYSYSVWLFTASDLTTTIIPASLFALFTASALGDISFQVGDWTDRLQRLPLSTLWVWMNLLLGVIGNQRQIDAIEEDRINKPWRVLPSGRMTIGQAIALERVLYPLVVIVALNIGGIYESMALIGLGFWYNKWGGADRHFVVRNLINVFGFTAFNSGALQVLLDSDAEATRVLRPWLYVVAAIVMTTVQIQDLRDQAGDSIRNRSTMPLVFGDAPTRWFSAACVMSWTVFVPLWWNLGIMSSLPCLVLGFLVTLRTVTYRDVEADKLTFTMWCVWLVVLYAMPALGPPRLSARLSF